MQNALDLFPFTDESQLMKGCLCVFRRGKANECFFQWSPFRLALCGVLNAVGQLGWSEQCKDDNMFEF